MFVSLWLVLLMGSAAGALVSTGGIDFTWGNETYTLVHASVLVRHGIITPKAAIPHSSVQWPNSKMLTGLGVKEAYTVGKWLRATYANLIGSDLWDPSDVSFRSSAMTRSNQAAICMALAMYPLGTGPSMFNAGVPPVLSDELSFQPVAINTVPDGTDSLLRAWTGATNCKAYRTHLKKLVQIKVYADKVAANREFLTRMQNVSGYRANDPLEKFLFDINSLQEAVSSELAHGYPFLGQSPSPISMEDYNSMKSLGDWNYVEQFRGFGRLLGGVFVGELIANFLRVANQGTGPKVSIYSAHQRTFFGVEYALNIVQGRVPPTGYRYTFERFSSPSNKHFVKVTGVDLKNNTQVISIPGCSSGEGQLCPLDRFIDLFSGVVPGNWRQECDPGFLEQSNHLACGGHATSWSAACGANCGVLINEVQAAGNEYIELFNHGKTTVDLTGWQLQDGAGNAFVMANQSIAPQSTLLVREQSLPFKMKKSGDVVTLQNSQHIAVDRVSWFTDKFGPTTTLSICKLGANMEFTPATPGASNLCQGSNSDNSCGGRCGLGTTCSNTGSCVANCDLTHNVNNASSDEEIGQFSHAPPFTLVPALLLVLGVVLCYAL